MILDMTVRALALLMISCRLCESTLNLSSFVEKNQLEKGREAAKVSPLAKQFENLKSYAGLFEVNKAYESYMFFWYFPPIKTNFEKLPYTPVIVWLEGGMGTSSMVNALRGNGPIRLSSDHKLSYNVYNWAVYSHLVYFDNPVGAGYSFTLKSGFPKNQREVAKDLYAALKQFIQLFELHKNPIYLAGEGCAGKYIPALGVMIDEENHNGTFKMNFEGIAIENGFIDPPNMLAYGKYLHQLGIIDERARNKFHKLRTKIENLLKDNKYQEAEKLYSKWMEEDKFEKHTGLPSMYDVTKVKINEDEEKILNSFLNKDSTRNSLNTQKITFSMRNPRIQKALEHDKLRSAAKDLFILMRRYQVLLYYGQMNIRYGYVLMIEALKKHKWVGYKAYWNKKRNKWYVRGEMAGYWRKGGNLTDLLMRNVGDRISTNQPKWAQRMIGYFIYSRSMND